MEERLRYLSTVAQPQVIMESGLERSGDRTETFRELFGSLTDGGRYVLRSVPAAKATPAESAESRRWTDLLAELAALGHQRPAGERSSTEALAQSLELTEELAGGWVVRKRLAHQWKLRDSRATTVLGRRCGAGWGEVITSKPAVSYASRARPQVHGDGLRTLKPTIRVPERWLRSYRDVTCYARKRVRMGDYWLPDTFRNPKMRVLGHRALESVSPYLARLPVESEPPVRTAPGAFFYLDSEYPSHFGHVMTDVVANSWGWPIVKERVPHVRPLLSLPAGQTSIPEFQRRIFTALEIDVDTIEYVVPGEGVRVEELYGCTSDWAIPGYGAPELASVWDRIRTGCLRTGPSPAGSSARIFVSRRPRGVRTCLNTAEVEHFFAGLGFQVLYPETLDFGDQVAVFSQAEVIAGFAGSAMFNAVFAPDATMLVLTGSSYTALNEYLIKSIIGGDIHYFWTPSELTHPASGWTWEAYRSNFVFDLDRFGPAIEAVLDPLPR